MTAEIVNLNKVRKARERAEKAKTAQDNRAKFGRAKAEREMAARELDQRTSALDGAQRDTPRLDDNHDDLDPGNVS